MNLGLLLRAVFGEEVKYTPTPDNLEKVLASLELGERVVLEHRFNNPSMTLKRVGKVLPRKDGGIGVTKARAGQIEKKALRKLRHPSRANLLWPKAERTTDDSPVEAVKPLEILRPGLPWVG